jgi:lactoylglutathione lyase
VYDPATGEAGPGVGFNHLAVQVESLEATRADLAAGGIEPEPVGYPGGPDGPRTCWITDPDGYRVEVVQWPDGHADGTTEADFA